jgi:ATP-dependent helicase HrpB
MAESGLGVPKTRDELPVDGAAPEVISALRRRGLCVVVAEPGAGKSTRLPNLLLDALFCQPGNKEQGRVVMVEPRRIAAESAARRLASQRGERLGETVGLRRRGKTVVGPSTRLEVVTDGVILQMLRHDPTLDGLALVIFDEVHERSLIGDASLAIALHVRRELRPDLMVLAMSATVDTESLSAFAGWPDDPAPVTNVAGRTFPVEVAFRRPDGSGLIDSVASATLDMVRSGTGDVLVFLPGVYEINAVARILQRITDDRVEVVPLHGKLTDAQQQQAFAVMPPGKTKVVLATTIAQTSLTIDGITAVVDSGRHRVLLRDPSTDLPRLTTEQISQATADQRSGRAGRTAPGQAIRCWSPTEHLNMRAYDTPRILEEDLTSLVLTTAQIGIADASALTWWTAPDSTSWTAAIATLQSLGALSPSNEVTERGALIASLPVHPRLAAMIVSASTGNGGDVDTVAASICAALLEDGLAPDDRTDLRSTVIDVASENSQRAYRIREAADRLRRIVDPQSSHRSRTTDIGPLNNLGRLIAAAFPERVGAVTKAGGDTYRFSDGTEVALREDDPLRGTPLLAVAALDADRRRGRIHAAVPVDLDGLSYIPSRLVTRITLTSSHGEGKAFAVMGREVSMWGDLAAQERPIAPSLEDVSREMVEAVRRHGLAILGEFNDNDVGEFRARLAALHDHDSATWPAVSDEALIDSLGDWLIPNLPPSPTVSNGVAKPLAGLSLHQAIRSMVPAAQWHLIDRLAPQTLSVNGRAVDLDWARGLERGEHRPVMAVFVTDLYGLTSTPTVLTDRRVLLELLSPARRPVALTDDLARFWREGYGDVRRDMRGRYPKHHWPDDPATASPGRKPRP